MKCCAKYQNTREAEEALERLTEAYLAMGIVDEAQTAAAVLGHNYPNSQWYQDAFDRLKNDGLSPQEHERFLDFEDVQEGRIGLTVSSRLEIGSPI